VYGQALFEAGRYDDAKGTFETALTLDPENLIALRHLGDIASTNGANEQAREWYVRVLDADPRNEEIIALLAQVDEQLKKDAGPAPAPRATPSEPTPVAPIASVATIQTPAVSQPAVPPPPAAPARESIGLMDLAIDFDSTPASEPEVQTPVNATPAVEADFPAFEEIQLGVPLEPSFSDAPPMAEGLMDPFADHDAEPIAPIEAPIEAHVTESAPAPIVHDDTVDLLFGDSLPAEPAPPFVTETMAELYLQQGFTAEALDVYRQLSAQSPNDERLKERVRKLERGERTSVALSSEAVPQGVPAATARSYFAALAARRAVQGNGRARTAPRVSAPRVSAPVVAAPEPAPVAAAAIVTVTSINELFGAGDVSAQDELIAGAFAQVAGAVEMKGSAVKGRPTAAAATELSLDSVFKGAEARVTATVPRQSQTLRFDQFFSTAAEEPAPAAPPAASAPAGEPGSPAEIQQFQSWLTGLKKP
jgi:tetratricopeptide (TPR) repeat protein